MMPDSAPFLSLEGASLYLREGDTTAPIHWTIRSDQHWAVVGPNGSGKASLVKAIAGQAPIARGQIAYHFLNNGASPRDTISHLSFESQSAALPFEFPFYQARWNRGVGQHAMSVSEYLSKRRVKGINPYLVTDHRTGPSGFEDYRAGIIELLGIEALLDRTLDQVSNGERRKVLLARALLKRPRLLILEDPFAGLDAAFRSKLQQILGDLMCGDLRLVLVTSGREPLPPGITHVLIMDRAGVVVQRPREEMQRLLSAAGKPDPGRPEMHPAGIVARQIGPGRSSGMAQDRGDHAQPLVEMRGVSVSYSGVQILDGVGWSVRAGENWALLGPNGAGKTTLLSLILGDNPQAYANDITLFGKRRGSGDTIWELKRRIGWVAPELHLYYPKNVPCFEVVCSGFHDAIGSHGRCSSQQRETARGWLQRLGLLGIGDLQFGAASEGAQRLVLIARALVKGPELLVLDEPCQGLDAANRDQVLRLVEALGDQAASSLIYVSHHRDALPRTITHLLRLEAGRVVSSERVRDAGASPVIPTKAGIHFHPPGESV
jgi:molybdate transport system ATP-binding protein